MRPLSALVRPQGYIPDFLTPPPAEPGPDFADELRRLRATDPELMRREVLRTWQDAARLPDGARAYLDRPEASLQALADSLEAYWSRLLLPHWPRLRAVLENDVLGRARQLALHGPAAMFNDLGPLMRFSGQTLELHQSLCGSVCEEGQPLGGRGLLLLPSAFVWPAFSTLLDPPWQPTLAYTPRGVATLWSVRPPAVGRALDLLLGRARAEVLLSLTTPQSTLALAGRLGLAPSSVSAQLGVLRQAGLVEPRRQGRLVYYRLSPTGCGLLDLFGAAALPEEASPEAALLAQAPRRPGRWAEPPGLQGTRSHTRSSSSEAQ